MTMVSNPTSEKTTKRHFRDAPNNVRCRADIVLRDGSKAQCGRKRSGNSIYCWQHNPLVMPADARKGGVW